MKKICTPFIVCLIVLIVTGGCSKQKQESKDKELSVSEQILSSSLLKFSGDLFPVKQNGKYGYIDKTGKVIIEPRFDFADKFYEGFARVSVDGKEGFID